MRSDRKQLRDDAFAMASHTQEALAARVLAVEISLASSSPSADVGKETSWLSCVPARLESIESSIAAMWNDSDCDLAAGIMDRLRALETLLASSIAAVGWHESVWLATVPERLQFLEASLAALSKSDKHLQVPDDVAEPCFSVQHRRRLSLS